MRQIALKSTNNQLAHFAVRFDFPEYLREKRNIISNEVILRKHVK